MCKRKRKFGRYSRLSLSAGGKDHPGIRSGPLQPSGSGASDEAGSGCKDRCQRADRGLFAGTQDREDQICATAGQKTCGRSTGPVSQSGRIFRKIPVFPGRGRGGSGRSALLSAAGTDGLRTEDQFNDGAARTAGLYQTDEKRDGPARCQERGMAVPSGYGGGEMHL